MRSDKSARFALVGADAAHQVEAVTTSASTITLSSNTAAICVSNEGGGKVFLRFDGTTATTANGHPIASGAAQWFGRGPRHCDLYYR